MPVTWQAAIVRQGRTRTLPATRDQPEQATWWTAVASLPSTCRSAGTHGPVRNTRRRPDGRGSSRGAQSGRSGWAHGATPKALVEEASWRTGPRGLRVRPGWGQVAGAEWLTLGR
jgi:hypothetical protein